MLMGDNLESAILKPEEGEDLDDAGNRRRLPDFYDARHLGTSNSRLVANSKLGSVIGPGTHAVVSVDLELASCF
jgi:hypothetical protein